MVHALNEAWRVLVPQGVMIDIRPLSVVVPLEVVYAGRKDIAGTADLRPGLPYNIDSDHAIETVVTQGIFTLSSTVNFDYAYYWGTYLGMARDFKERWEGEIIISDEVLEKVQWLYRQKRPGAQLRLPMRMKMNCYEKLG